LDLTVHPLIDLKTNSRNAEIDTLIKESALLEIEIGSGNGHFIVTYGEKKRDTRLIGIEAKKKRCTKIIEKIEKRNLHHIAVVLGRGEDLLRLLPPFSVDAFHIYFPDPWPKSKHRKRRFFRLPVLNLIAKALKDRGMLYFATDYFDYALQAKVLISLHESFSLADSLPPEEVFLSVYANKFKRIDRPVRFIAAVKIAH
jgi:tRNA (guanine-N7-)-methyltransferase